MPFQTIGSETESKKLIDRFLKNRAILKTRLDSDKIGKQTFQRDVAAELQRPVVEQQEKLEKSRQKKTDERQSELIDELQESQRAITDKLDDQEVAMQRTLLQLQQLPQQPALAAAPRRSPIDIDPDVGLDKNLLREMNLSTLTELTTAPTEHLEGLKQEIATLVKSLNGRKRGRNFTEQNEKELDTLRKYNSGLKRLIEGKKAGIVPTRTGTGVKSKNPYKLTPEGMFGTLWIDIEKLGQLRLEAYRDGKKVLTQKIDRDLVELLTKRYNSRRTYSPSSTQIFAKLIDLSGVVNPRSKKYGVGRAGPRPASRFGGRVSYYKTPDDLVERLHILIGAKQGGKVSKALDNEVVTILDRLYEDKVVNGRQYRNIYNKYIDKNGL